MPFRHSDQRSRGLSASEALIQDLRDAPVRHRATLFRLLQQNILAYTFDAGIPGWTAAGLNGMDFHEVVEQPLANAEAFGTLLFGTDFRVESNAKAKVSGDIYEVLTSAVLWETAARWNQLMRGGVWPASPRYARPAINVSVNRQVGVLNLPRRYDWVRLLTPTDRAKIDSIRHRLSIGGLSMPTSTPDVAIVVLPEDERSNDYWVRDLGNLSLNRQQILDGAHRRVEGKIEAGEIILAIALKRSLRSDRLYQPLYEANVMQYLLEAELGAPRVDFEVHALDASGTSAPEIYRAAALHSASSDDAHRAVRELYQPVSATQIVNRFLQFLNTRLELVDP